ncbi:hypothetical protein A3D00_03775 [Candidatus Woesebacteria bacterium RIFCSPHIGHO2_02_FULL_38_9]|uniref:IMP dehydrogenase/GMP reductase domain-containing protein n=1 Tax=Candidatus Woesebacteria bacterium RIFCSPHIGHO2_01_FULL_39_28 TaxID=1802496 RepID=A0A1F7YCG8_9BACT|nr:MAG: hypothetical protein A2627_04990 [Candidatus Woesebacteria bacterium RIFCSPHIGHO2_01_FULL_39_28]OGM33950.1 MAG: hypothetical protein A3D00_03775 [Candidatus Woesebacteria bacterium RIFCSPHIGHO2_02_FULL_38_9]OGM57549.1 MAG: hypothetical protein A3A50_06105 [Candidatus Woesebacteria bacterium RIFCSPLOWO2_01_FULL_38_20]
MGGFLLYSAKDNSLSNGEVKTKPPLNKNILSSSGYKGYERYFNSSLGDKAEWMKLHDLDGEIYEKEKTDNYSVFALGNGFQQDNFGQGLLLTDIDKEKVHRLELKKSAQWRIRKAMAQRAFYLSLCNSTERIKRIINLENNSSRKMSIARPILFPYFEDRIGNGYSNSKNGKVKVADILESSGSTYFDYKDFGYLVRFSTKKLSRHELVNQGIYTKLGKHIRSVFCLSPMPDSSGSIDAIATSAMCHMLSVIPRNLRLFDIGFQANFAAAVIDYLNHYELPPGLNSMEKEIKRIWLYNICAAIGSQENDLERFKTLYKSGVRSFRIYSIATDTRIRDITQKITNYILENLIDTELFVGQITSIQQFWDLYKHLNKKQWELINGFYIGNGGGSRCKTAETGMVVSSPYLSYQIRRTGLLDNKSLIIEGGVGTEPAAALLLGADGLSYSAGATGGCIESPGGALYIYSDSKQEYWKPYRGEASPSVKIVEGVLYPTGDAKQVEGKNGFVRMEKKCPSMCARILMLNEWLSQSLVKLGINSMLQLKNLGTILSKNEVEEIYEQSPWQTPDIIKLDGIHDKNSDIQKYIIPLPLYKRSSSQRRVASAYGLVDEAKIGT